MTSSSETLCLNLMSADSEAEVIGILRDAGYWDDPSCWRDLGDEPENYSTVGNQQSRAEQALVEKLVNAIDTKLMAACRLANIDPGSDAAPDSMIEARDRFFGEALQKPDLLARGITVAATGARAPGRMSISIADDGEGQTPRAMPTTILSVLKGSKKNVRFVQGRFHMGGTGVLEFCGRDHNVQFVLSRRNPGLLPSPPVDSSDADWSFTIIRREDPQGRARGSRFTFLAPGDPDDQGRKGLLHFSASELPIFPDKAQAYARQAQWGTLFKLYEYDVRLKGNIILSDSLMYRVRVMLAEPAIPIRFHECRTGFRGHSGSFDTTMKGLIPTLDDDRRSEKRDNVEYFDRFDMDVDGERFSGRIYLFKDKKAADAYRRDEGIVFTYNGQTHATYSKDFFRRASVKQDYLWQSLLVFIDCSAISVRGHERLFMPGRDRLRMGELARELEQAIEDKLRTHGGLRERAEQRRARERAQAPEVSDNFRKFLEDMVKRYSALANLLGPGLAIKNPHKPLSVVGEDKPWVGNRFPTRFHFRGIEPSTSLARDAYLNAQVRLTMETDAEDEYFSRDEDPGSFSLQMLTEAGWVPAKNWRSPNLSRGVAHFSLALPAEAEVGSIVRYRVEVTDPSRIEPFHAEVALSVRPERAPAPPPNPTPHPGPKPPSPKPGDERNTDGTLGIPEPTEVYEATWTEHEFNRWTAMVIKAPPGEQEGPVLYDYYVNMDNSYLLDAIKQKPKLDRQFRRQFKLGMTIVALALVHQSLGQKPAANDGSQDEEGKAADWNIADQVRLMTTAIAPFLLPMVESLGDLEEEEEPLSASAGEAA